MPHNLKGWKHQKPRPVPHPSFGLIHGFGDAMPLPSSAKVAQVPDAVNQGYLSDCVANATCATVGALDLRLGLTMVQRSRLKLYYDIRVNIEKEDPTEDSGCLVSEAMEAARKYGFCPESMWGYDESKYSVAPSGDADAEALKHTALLTYHCPTLTEIKASIAQGFPVVFGFVAFPSLETEETAKTGMIPMPVKDEVPIGGHCVLAVEYDDSTGMIKILNSWGPDWGVNGHGFLSYQYWNGPIPLADDAWTIRVVS